MSLLAPGSTTVGAIGGYLQGGGFSTIVSSKLGLMSDQVLSFEVSIANETFLVAKIGGLTNSVSGRYC
jgi:hypothetical protein